MPQILPSQTETLLQNVTKIATSRRALRTLLLAQRYAMTAQMRHDVQRTLASRVLAWLTQHLPQGGVVTVYVATQGEADILTALLKNKCAAHYQFAVPVVVNKVSKILQFAAYGKNETMTMGAYGIAVPAVPRWLQPDVVFAPCVGFCEIKNMHDSDKSQTNKLPTNEEQTIIYRLGYGGGFYDATLADLRTKAQSVKFVGVGFSCASCVFAPHAADIALDDLICV